VIAGWNLEQRREERGAGDRDLVVAHDTQDTQDAAKCQPRPHSIGVPIFLTYSVSIILSALAWKFIQKGLYSKKAFIQKRPLFKKQANVIGMGNYYFISFSLEIYSKRPLFKKQANVIGIGIGVYTC